LLYQFTLGQELSSVTAISCLTSGWHQAHNKPIAGEFYAFGVDIAGVSEEQLETLKANMEKVKSRLESKKFGMLTKDEILGDMLYSAAMSYFAVNDGNLQMLNYTGETLAYRHPSFGTFATNLSPVFSFGVPTQVGATGLMVDMDVVQQSLWAKNNDVQLSRATVQQVGHTVSALEHQIPELFFSNEGNSGEGVSAIKALAIASAQGQRIYQINQDNIDFSLPQLEISNEVKREIQISVEIGKEVLVSQRNVNVLGWTGVGYIIIDPETGAGAYRISGGANGGEMSYDVSDYGIFIVVGLGLILAFLAPSILFYAFAILWLTLLTVISIAILAVIAISKSLLLTFVASIILGFMGFGFSCTGLLAGLGLVVMSGYLSMILSFLIFIAALSLHHGYIDDSCRPT